MNKEEKGTDYSTPLYAGMTARLKNIKCPYCGYDGSDSSKRNPIEITQTGVAQVTCAECGRKFNI